MELLQNWWSNSFNYWHFDYYKLYSSYKLLYFDNLSFPNYAWLMSDISVLGIFVADISFSGPKIPAVGETILGKKYNVGPGGKGCNQA